MTRFWKTTLGFLAAATEAVGWLAAVGALISFAGGIAGIIFDPSSGFGWLAVAGLPLLAVAAVLVLAGRMLRDSLRQR